MLNLQQLVKEFISSRLQEFEAENEHDVRVLEAIGPSADSHSLTHEDRVKRVHRWMIHYKVTRNTGNKATEVAGEIVAFADGRSQGARLRSVDEIVSKFEALKSRIDRVAPLRKDGCTPTDLSVLTSKALWCCYPEDAPMMDQNALTSLRVLSRILDLKPSSHAGGSEFCSFVDMWLQLYSRVEPVIQVDARRWPFKGRVLDKFLWYLGQPSFEKVPN